MIEYLEALIALSEHGTLRRSALSLHVTQSALSKRIATLEGLLNARLTTPSGRFLVLTPAGMRLVERCRPLLQELKAVCRLESGSAAGRLDIDIASSVLLGGGGALLAAARTRLPELQMQLHNYHASVALERVRSGHTMLALVQGDNRLTPELSSELIWNQEMVIVPSGLKAFRPGQNEKIKLMAIEKKTESWRHTELKLQTYTRGWASRIEVSERLQSYSAIIHLACHGFGHGLAPASVASELGVNRNQMVSFPEKGVHVPVSLIGRKSLMGLDYASNFVEVLQALAAKIEMN